MRWLLNDKVCSQAQVSLQVPPTEWQPENSNHRADDTATLKENNSCLILAPGQLHGNNF